MRTLAIILLMLISLPLFSQPREFLKDFYTKPYSYKDTDPGIIFRAHVKSKTAWSIEREREIKTLNSETIYDTLGRLVLIKSYDHGDLSSTEENTFDESGNLIRNTYTKLISGWASYILTYEYTYDSIYRLIKQEQKDSGRFDSLLIMCIYYNNDNSLTRVVTGNRLKDAYSEMVFFDSSNRKIYEESPETILGYRTNKYTYCGDTIYSYFYLDDTLESSFCQIYNRNGIEIYYAQTYPPEETHIIFVEDCNSIGRTVSRKVYDEEENLETLSQLTYDSTGNLIILEVYDSKNVLTTKEERTFDANNLLIMDKRSNMFTPFHNWQNEYTYTYYK